MAGELFGVNDICIPPVREPGVGVSIDDVSTLHFF